MRRDSIKGSFSIKNIETPVVFKTLSIVSLTFIGIIIVGLFLPWRQTVTGVGSVIVYSQMNRPQMIQSQIDAKVKKWHVQEGDFVEAGDSIVELQEINTQYLDENQAINFLTQRQALANKVDAINDLISSYEAQIQSLLSLKDNIVPNAELKIKQNENKLTGLKQKILGLEQNKVTAELNQTRREKLYEKGLASQRELELARLAVAKATAELRSAEAELNIFEQQISISRFDLNKVGLENQFKIQDTQAKIADAYNKLAEAKKDLATMDNKIANLQERIDQRSIKALVSGQVTGVKAAGTAQTIKKNELIATIVPETEDIAVELYVSEFFAPLLSTGRKVRVQFSGYPAIQFSGWPSIAVGTFAGEIVAVDAVNLKEGEFRALIKPDQERIDTGEDEPWPSLATLRPGSKAWGWILLDDVPVWFELWRVLNGFPPSIMQNKNKVTEVPKIK